MLQKLSCCAFGMAGATCVVNDGGNTVCSNLDWSQCATRIGCSWTGSQETSSPLATAGCKYLQINGTDLYKDERDACALLDTKEACHALGREVGSYGCSWWDVGHCDVDNLSVVWRPFWGCQSQAACENVLGNWCGVCTLDNLNSIWKGSGHYSSDLLSLAVENRGKCIEGCAMARDERGFEASKRLCDQVAGCGFAGSGDGYCFQHAGVRGFSLLLPLFAAFLVLVAWDCRQGPVIPKGWQGAYDCFDQVLCGNL